MCVYRYSSLKYGTFHAKKFGEAKIHSGSPRPTSVGPRPPPSAGATKGILPRVFALQIHFHINSPTADSLKINSPRGIRKSRNNNYFHYLSKYCNNIGICNVMYRVLCFRLICFTPQFKLTPCNHRRVQAPTLLDDLHAFVAVGLRNCQRSYNQIVTFGTGFLPFLYPAIVTRSAMYDSSKIARKAPLAVLCTVVLLTMRSAIVVTITSKKAPCRPLRSSCDSNSFHWSSVTTI